MRMLTEVPAECGTVRITFVDAKEKVLIRQMRKKSPQDGDRFYIYVDDSTDISTVDFSFLDNKIVWIDCQPINERRRRILIRRLTESDVVAPTVIYWCDSVGFHSIQPKAHKESHFPLGGEANA